MTSPLFIAVDLGAGSGRVVLAGFDDSEFILQQVRRFHYPPSISAGHLRWDIPKIFAEIKEGLREAATRAHLDEIYGALVLIVGGSITRWLMLKAICSNGQSVIAMSELRA